MNHFVLGTKIKEPTGGNMKEAIFGMGCFWGAEKLFWQLEGVFTTAVGYSGGDIIDPTYTEVCTGRTNHAEVVRVVYDPDLISLRELLSIFWTFHDPTQKNRQGNDRGSQYRSAIYLKDETDISLANITRENYQKGLTKAGYGSIQTEIGLLEEFYFAEDYHQQYLAKNPYGYCPNHATGVACNI